MVFPFDKGTPRRYKINVAASPNLVVRQAPRSVRALLGAASFLRMKQPPLPKIQLFMNRPLLHMQKAAPMRKLRNHARARRGRRCFRDRLSIGAALNIGQIQRQFSS